eukprot:TRINITY_DN14546_c0_g1_i1.p1 TRINITY_DN14546_c0_g1~~TRINITY_DN14546_c0_g1_i1.p1  ORF type:complete len:221 (+),score=54.09 TRINITY_DN14546_c0_g1_i1:26-688(+)
MWAPNIWKVGVTGGIGAGKSNIARIIASQGGAVLDADKLGHRTYEPGTPTFNRLAEVFGKSIVDEAGQINRKALGGLVFGNPANMKRLTDIVWPGINQLAREEILKFEREGRKVVFLEAAILIEANWLDLVDEVWVAAVPPAVAKDRIMKRNGLTEAQAEERIKSQLTNEERTKHADVVIITDRPKEETEVIVNGHYKELQQKINSFENLSLLREKKSKL